MRKFLLIPLFMGALLNAQVTTFPWLETFEDNSPTQSQWTYEFIAGTNSSATNGVFWTIKGTTSVGYYGTTGPYEGSKMAVFDTRSHSRDAIGRFISPILDLSSETSPTLDFFYRNMLWGSDQNELKIYYRTSATAPWTLITTFNTNITSFTNSGTITLPNPSATYQIALEGVAKYGYGLDVDNLQIQTGSLATQETQIQKPKLTLVPNPVTDFLNIKSSKNLAKVSIIDYNGKIILEKHHLDNNSSIDVKHLTPGMYLLTSTDKEGQVESTKFIKK